MSPVDVPQPVLGAALSETAETRRKRLLHRSRYRGQLEADLLFGGFAAAHLATMSEDQLGRYEALLEESDVDLLAWVSGRRPVPARHDHDVLAMLRGFKIQG
jgi:antitoxin CptB